MKESSAMDLSFLAALLTILSAFNPLLSRPAIDTAMAQSPTPTPDRLAEPFLPANPTQYEQGRHLYWMNCMPCHGDKGQGLTDEFRSLWVDDHQNCWGRGCHGGRQEDQGFPLPRTIPAIIASSGDSLLYGTAEQLFEYLRTTHPPQHPGYLPEDEYWAITAYVLTENKRLPLGQEVGPQAQTSVLGTIQPFAALAVVLLIVSVIIVWSRRRQKTRKISDD
jgi:mono/diheme cytochrome c family protein